MNTSPWASSARHPAHTGRRALVPLTCDRGVGKSERAHLTPGRSDARPPTRFHRGSAWFSDRRPNPLFPILIASPRSSGGRHA
jgi:hypothetical protein